MKKTVFAVAAITLLLSASGAFAQANKGGLGFRTLNGPATAFFNTDITFASAPAIGIRQWFSETMALDFALGYTSLKTEENPGSVQVDEGTGFVMDLGLPFVAKKFDKVNFIVRPGLEYGKATAKDVAPGHVPPDEFEVTLMAVTGELEVEYMLTDNLSISAAHGVSYSSLKAVDNSTPTNRELKLTGFETTGSNFTQLGFHIYMW